MAEPQYKVGDSVRVTLGKEYVGTVLEVRRDELEGYVYYIVSIPPEARLKGRNYSEQWAYREQYLAAAPRG